jgi:hypothetical protein
VADPTVSDDDRNVSNPCTFACHFKRPNLNGTIPPGHRSTYDAARAYGILLRIDVATSGVAAFVDDASAISGGDFQYSLATFNNHYREVLPITNDIAAVKNELTNVTLGYPDAMGVFKVATTPDDWNGFRAFADDLAAYMSTPAAQGRSQYIILVTDGVRSEPSSSFLSGKVHEFYPAYCDTLKATHAKVGVLYTEYLPDNTSQPYIDDVLPFQHKIKPALEACASSTDLFAMGDTPGQIMTAFSSILATATAGLYLSQ